jgi:hypothetical protein
MSAGRALSTKELQVHIPTFARLATLAAVVGALGACGGSKEGRDRYVGDADSGAAAPATVPTPDNPATPESTLGVGGRTGAPAAAGDTSAARGGAVLNNPQSAGSATTPVEGKSDSAKRPSPTAPPRAQKP